MRSSPDHSFLWGVPALQGVDAFKACFSRFAYARHSHDSFALGTIEEGAMHFWHGGAGHTAGGGAVIAINPGEVHDGRSASPGGCRYRMLYVEPAAIDQLFDADAPRIRSTFALRGPVLADPQLAQLIRRFHESLDGDSVFPVTEVLTKLENRCGAEASRRSFPTGSGVGRFFGGGCRWGREQTAVKDSTAPVPLRWGWSSRESLGKLSRSQDEGRDRSSWSPPAPYASGAVSRRLPPGEY